MSPEYNFHLTVDLPNDKKAHEVVNNLLKIKGLIGVLVYQSAEEIPSELIELTKEMNFAKTYRLFRQTEGITQAEISRRAQMDPANLNRFETGRTSYTPRIDSVIKLVGALGLRNDDQRIAILLRKAAAEREKDGDMLLSMIGQI